MLSRVFRRQSNSHCGRFALLPFLVCCLVALPPIAAAQTPTAEQLEIFRSLPADQQQSLLQTLTGGSGTSATGTRADAASVQANPSLDRSLDQRRSDERRLDPQSYRLRGDDTLLLSLEIREFTDPDPASLVLLQGAPSTGEATAGMTTAATTAVSQVPRERIVRTEDERASLDALRERILRRNPYQLDGGAVLNVLELGPIQLGGLTVEEARKRIAADYLLRDFVVGLTLLPLEPTGTAALKPFGYDLFAGSPSTFAPVTDVPVPAEYVVGPGDSLRVQLIGTTRGNYSLAVGRDGQVNFPSLGPIAVGGMRFEDVRQLLEQRVGEQMIGTQASVSMGQLRTIRVFVLGEAEVPGSYTVGGLSTMTNALFASGGVKPIGSLRNIELKRNGATVSRLDLYDLLLRGDTSGDARLQPGDVIFIPPVGVQVGMTGEVIRPATYELSGERSIADLVALAGGFRPTAEPELATLERIGGDRQRMVISVDAGSAAGLQMAVSNGDVVRIPGVRPVVDNVVSVAGHVHRPRDVQYRPGLRLSDVLRSIDDLKPNAEQRYVLVRRELPPDRRVAAFSADLSAALAQRGSAADIELAARDRIHVFDRESGRDRVLEPLMRELQMQSSLDQPFQAVSVGGRVKVPGQYPLEPGMRVSDLIRAGGSLDDAAFGGTAELTRYDTVNGQTRRSELIQIDLAQVRAGNPAADLPLQPADFLVIKELPDWSLQERVTLVGEVRFPGTYPIRKGETLRSVIERAGGLTQTAFPEGSIFTRVALRDRERQQITDLTRRMETDLAQLALTAAQATTSNAAGALAVGQSLLAGLRSAEPVGRLVIDLRESAVAAPGSQADIVLKDGDRLMVPRITQEVTVIGEVQSATSHLYDPGYGRNDYIELSGGTTARADRGRTYVVRANGSVVASGGSAWFSTSRNVDMQPGDTVVVPLDVDRLPALPTWTSVTQILYNLAVAVAAVNSF